MDAVCKSYLYNLFVTVALTLRHNNGTCGMTSTQVNTGAYRQFGTSMVKVLGWD